MDIKKFLKDNKGCPLTVPAIKQLLVKFIELMSKKGVVKDEVTDIKELSKETLDELQVGDIVQKVTGNKKHAYMVTYKGEGAGEGICLTYCAAGYMETVSYDRSGSNWVYNSTDVVEVSPEAMAWVEQMKDVLSVDDSYLTSMKIFKGEFYCDDLILEQINYLKNVDDEPFFPSLTNQAGKAVVVNDDETGFEYKERNDVSVTDHTDYITLTIGANSYDLEKHVTPSGYQVTLTDDNNDPGYYFDFTIIGALEYSIDGGTTWNPISSFPVNVNATQIMFRGYASDTDYAIRIGTTPYTSDVFYDDQSGTMQTSSNISLSGATTFYFWIEHLD